MFGHKSACVTRHAVSVFGRKSDRDNGEGDWVTTYNPTREEFRISISADGICLSVIYVKTDQLLKWAVSRSIVSAETLIRSNSSNLGRLVWE